jgi:hypothetical protein
METKNLQNLLSKEERLLIRLIRYKNTMGVKVQSVVLPVTSNIYFMKTEEQVLDWLQNKIHSQHSAYYQFKNKYNQNSEQINWNKNKIQNERFLETSNR